MGLRISTQKTAEQLIKYHTGQKGLEAYYCENQEFIGYWGGKAAKILGLEGYVSEQAFAALAQNLHPLTGKQLTGRMREDRRAGFDITFDLPKSVSLAWAYSKDDRIIQGLRQVVSDMAADMEQNAAARVRAGLEKNADHDRTTGNWVTAEIIHLTARPEDGYSDPLIHIHLVVFNLTFDPVEKKWKALQMVNIHNEADNYQSIFHRRMIDKLRELGLGIVESGKSFEIEGISRDLIDKFSRRTKTINETAERLGITDPEQKAKLGVMTRERKNKELLISDLEPFWWGTLSPEHTRQLEGVKALLERSRAVEMSRQMTHAPATVRTGDALGALDRMPVVAKPEASSQKLGTKARASGREKRQSMNRRTRPGPTVVREVAATEHDRRAVRLAVEHCLTRSSVVTEVHLLGEACRNWGRGQTSYLGIRKAIREAGLLHGVRNGITYVTTQEVWNEEKRLKERCVYGKGRFEPMNSHWQIYDEKLNAEQRSAVFHALNSRDFIQGISGIAGAGKTRVLQEIKRGAEAGLTRLIALGPLAATAHEILRKDGFAEAETIARFMLDESLQESARGAALLVDEAGLISMRLGDPFFEKAEKLGARVILVGDTGQNNPVERGRAFEFLRKDAGMAVAELTEIQRQDGAYRQFVELYASGEVRRAVTSLWSMGAMHELPLEELRRRLAADYVEAIERGKKAMVVAPTHVECDYLTEAIRENLKAKKRLGAGVVWDTLKNLSFTDAQKSDPDHYQRGQVVQFNGHVKGFALGEQVEVLSHGDGVVRVRQVDGYHSKIKALPLSHPETFSVYERAKMEICPGDLLHVTCNGRTEDRHRLSNSTIHAVDYIDQQGRLVLENGWRVGRDFKHLDYGWVVTPFVAQGKTVDVVLASQTMALSAPATNRRGFHVASTRGREELKVYTDNFEWLKDAVTVDRERPMVMELDMSTPGQERGLLAAELGRHGPESLEADAPERVLSTKLGGLDTPELIRGAGEQFKEIMEEGRLREMEKELEIQRGLAEAVEIEMGM